MSSKSPYIKKNYDAHAIAWAKRIAEDARKLAKDLGQLERIAGHNLHGRDILNAQATAADLDLHYRPSHEKKSLFPLQAITE